MILGYLRDAPDTLRACALVCHLWLELARPFLFHAVVCRPTIPSYSLQDLVAFLADSPELVRHVRSVNVRGANPDPTVRYATVITEDMAAVLATLPNVQHVRFELVVFSLRAEDCTTTPLPSSDRRAIDSFTLRRCIVKDDHSFYQLFTAMKRISTLAFDHVQCMESRVQYPTFPEDFLQIDAIHMMGLLTRAQEPLKGFFRDLRSHTPLRLSLSITSHREDDTRAGTFLTALKNDVTSLSVNVLGAICTPEWMVDGLPRGFELGVRPHINPTECTSLTHIGLFFTTTNALRGYKAMRVYMDIIIANASLVRSAPTSLRRIEFRFQRQGPYVRHTVDELRALDKFAERQWLRLDRVIMRRFPRLEELVFVLCDERGFLEQFPSLRGKVRHVPGQYSKQVEFDDYVGWLKTAFPRLYERGSLRFEMSSDRVV